MMGYLGIRLRDNWSLESTIDDATLARIERFLRQPGSVALMLSNESGLGKTLIFRQHMISARIDYLEDITKEGGGHYDNSSGIVMQAVVSEGLPQFKQDEDRQ
jgi:hypothetical protein